MSLDQILRQKPSGAAGIVHWLSTRLGTVTRRDVFVGAAVAGSALATNPTSYALKPQTAYATICGPGNTFASGWTVFCATVNGGKNVCPPGSFAAGWWKAAGSSWCGGGFRYIVDCNATCSKCTSGCADHICDSGCWSCGCTSGPSTSCDQRRHCCNAFRYGQCNTHVSCSGGVNCRVVSCVPPYQWASCSTTSFQDDRTSEHSSEQLPKWGSNSFRYRQMGEFMSYLGGSIGPERSVGDGKGYYIDYQGGSIYWCAATGAKAMDSWTTKIWRQNGGPTGPLGYPTVEPIKGLRDSGFVSQFQGGAITDSVSTTTCTVLGAAWTAWKAMGREVGALGYPTANAWRDATGAWYQMFQTGIIAGASANVAYSVYGVASKTWQAVGGAAGILGYPIADVNRTNGWMQLFQKGAIVTSGATPMVAVAGATFAAWTRLGRQTGSIGYPLSHPLTEAAGAGQRFQNGEIWGPTGGAAWAVRSKVLAAWQAAGAGGGRYGYPLQDTVFNSNGSQSQRFQRGTITVA